MIKKILSVTLSLLTVAALMIFNTAVKGEAETNDSEIIIEKLSGRVLYQKDPDEKRYIASLTKIMTAIVVIENCDLEKKITVPAKCCGIEGSSVYLKPNEVLSVEDLLYGLMLRSGNDCAETLAVTLFGSIDSFARKMNEKAREIGAENTNFVNPHGLYDGENYSTARDMAYITAYGMKLNAFRKIAGSRSKVITDSATGESRYLKNKNKLLFGYEPCIGVKTGYTKKAGRCLASAAVKGNTELISVVLNCGPMYEISERNFEAAFARYETIELLNRENFSFESDVGGKEKARGYIKESFSYPLTDDEKSAVETKIVTENGLKAPLKKDEIIGRIDITLENQLIFSQNIYSILDVEKKFGLSDAIKNWRMYNNR
ncbi:MAG: D-alanyl-D-alanine carboxypeptidase [Clostridia bacterium]|nr:D-alanyl-D-alanine carboxypeptidase [Clostridia bacterium]